MEGQLRFFETPLTLQDPALARMEARHRGLDILQILQALLAIGKVSFIQPARPPQRISILPLRKSRGPSNFSSS
jgi:hypothetical protein